MKEVREVPPQEPALQTQVVASEYLVIAESNEPEKEVQERVGRVLAEAELPQVRRGKSYDLRALIDNVRLEQDEAVEPGHLVLGMILAAREGATGRPEAVLEALGLGGSHAQYRRLRLILGPG